MFEDFGEAAAFAHLAAGAEVVGDLDDECSSPVPPRHLNKSSEEEDDEETDVGSWATKSLFPASWTPQPSPRKASTLVVRLASPDTRGDVRMQRNDEEETTTNTAVKEGLNKSHFVVENNISTHSGQAEDMAACGSSYGVVERTPSPPRSPPLIHDSQDGQWEVGSRERPRGSADGLSIGTAIHYVSTMTPSRPLHEVQRLVLETHWRRGSDDVEAINATNVVGSRPSLSELFENRATKSEVDSLIIPPEELDAATCEYLADNTTRGSVMSEGMSIGTSRQRSNDGDERKEAASSAAGKRPSLRAVAERVVQAKPKVPERSLDMLSVPSARYPGQPEPPQGHLTKRASATLASMFPTAGVSAKVFYPKSLGMQEWRRRSSFESLQQPCDTVDDSVREVHQPQTTGLPAFSALSRNKIKVVVTKSPRLPTLEPVLRDVISVTSAPVGGTDPDASTPRPARKHVQATSSRASAPLTTSLLQPLVVNPAEPAALSTTLQACSKPPGEKPARAGPINSSIALVDKIRTTNGKLCPYSLVNTGFAKMWKVPNGCGAKHRGTGLELGSPRRPACVIRPFPPSTSMKGNKTRLVPPPDQVVRPAAPVSPTERQQPERTFLGHNVDGLSSSLLQVLDRATRLRAALPCTTLRRSPPENRRPHF